MASFLSRKVGAQATVSGHPLAGFGYASAVAREQFSEEFGRLLAAWSQRSSIRSVLKVSVYLIVCAGLIAAILSFQRWAAILLCQMLLGLAYAHGLELAHECLHHNMFRRPFWNRLFGFAAGVPLLISYSHYKYQHLHHHRFIGTPDDKELVDYEEKLLRNPLAFIARAWNFGRIPAFWRTLFRMCRGIYPPVFSTPGQRRSLFVEYVLLAAIFIAALTLTVSRHTNVFVLIWFVPWLIFGEAFHFFIELPEHLGRDKHQRDIHINTRSYRCGRLLNYIINGNNYHVEHHLYPRVAVHNLERLNLYLNPQIQYTLPSYLAALHEAVEGAPDLNQPSTRVS